MTCLICAIAPSRFVWGAFKVVPELCISCSASLPVSMMCQATCFAVLTRGCPTHRGASQTSNSNCNMGDGSQKNPKNMTNSRGDSQVSLSVAANTTRLTYLLWLMVLQTFHQMQEAKCTADRDLYRAHLHAQVRQKYVEENHRHNGINSNKTLQQGRSYNNT